MAESRGACRFTDKGAGERREPDRQEMKGNPPRRARFDGHGTFAGFVAMSPPLLAIGKRISTPARAIPGRGDVRTVTPDPARNGRNKGRSTFNQGRNTRSMIGRTNAT
jgi:hypothetical protein